jgi:hypothetical protein
VFLLSEIAVINVYKNSIRTGSGTSRQTLFFNSTLQKEKWKAITSFEQVKNKDSFTVSTCKTIVYYG